MQTMSLANAPGVWRWEQRGTAWWRIHDALNIEDGPHDHPNGAAVMNNDHFLQDLDAVIAQHGWAVQGVVAEEGVVVAGPPSWCYTVGLEDRGLPELLIVGLDPRTAQTILNDAAQHLIDGAAWSHGDRVEELLRGYDMAVVAVTDEVATAGDWFNVAFARRGSRTDLDVLQLVWPDRDGDYLDTARQPILGAL